MEMLLVLLVLLIGIIYLGRWVAGRPLTPMQEVDKYLKSPEALFWAEGICETKLNAIQWWALKRNLRLTWQWKLEEAERREKWERYLEAQREEKKKESLRLDLQAQIKVLQAANRAKLRTGKKFY